MQAKRIEPNRIELQKGMAQEVFDRIEGRGKTYYIETYGCQMNVRDSETIAGLLQEMGYSPAEGRDTANVILFNTCCVRDHAEKRLLANIGALKERKEEDPGLIIGICGCMMQQADVAKKVMRRFPFVNFVFGTNVLWRLPELMLSALSGAHNPTRKRASAPKHCKITKIYSILGDSHEKNADDANER